MRTTALLLLLLAGCSATRLYDGPSRPTGEVATIRVRILLPPSGSPGDEEYEVRLVGVNDRSFEDPPTTVEVLPGKHTLHLQWTKHVMPRFFWANSDSELIHWRRVGSGQRSMEVEVEAGKRYRLIVPWESSGLDWYLEEIKRPESG
jgi:hypothetical protein